MANTQSFWITPKGFAALTLIGAVIYFLLMEHRAHFFAYFPFLILLLCPVMHMFMHGGHGHTGHGGQDGDEQGGHRPVELSKNEAYRKGLEEGRKQASQSKLADRGR